MRYKLTVSYDGYNYMGFQIQNELDTIELELMIAFNKLLNVDVKIYPSGRTDRYVHANGQVCHVDLNMEIPEYGLIKGLNAYLPNDIYIKEVEKVNEDFHARFSAIKKEYRYYINIKEYNPLTIKYLPYIPNLNIEAMKEAVELLIGTHDFKGFASASLDERTPTIKTIYSIDIINHGDKLEFIFIGNGFLKYQIRRMMALLISIVQYKETKEKILQLYETKEKQMHYRNTPGCGLYLYRVDY